MILTLLVGLAGLGLFWLGCELALVLWVRWKHHQEHEIIVESERPRTRPGGNARGG